MRGFAEWNPQSGAPGIETDGQIASYKKPCPLTSSMASSGAARRAQNSWSGSTTRPSIRSFPSSRATSTTAGSSSKPIPRNPSEPASNSSSSCREPTGRSRSSATSSARSMSDQATPDGVAGMGIEFENLDSDVREQINEIIQRLRSTGGSRTGRFGLAGEYLGFALRSAVRPLTGRRSRLLERNVARRRP